MKLCCRVPVGLRQAIDCTILPRRMPPRPQPTTSKHQIVIGGKRFTNSTGSFFDQFCSTQFVDKLEHSELLKLRENEQLSMSLQPILSAEFEHTRHSLYPNSSDPLMNLLNRTESVEEILQLNEQNRFNELQASQALVSIWDIISHKTYSSDEGTVSFFKNLSTEARIIKEHPSFSSLVQTLERSASQSVLSDEALVTTLLNFRRFGIPPWHISVHRLFCSSLVRLEHFNLIHLAQWSLSVRDSNTCGRILLAAALPSLDNYISKCTTTEDVHALSISYVSATSLITEDMAMKFGRLVERLLNTGVINSETPIEVLSKITQALKISMSHAPVTKICLRVLELIGQSPELDISSAQTVLSINTCLSTVMEPYQLMSRIEDLASDWLESGNIGPEHLDPISIISHYPSSERKELLEARLKQFLMNEKPEDLEPYYRSIFSLLRRHKIVNFNLTDMFWLSVIKFISQNWNDNGKPESIFYRAIHWYMFFNNNMGGTYRCEAFEVQMLKWIKILLESEMAATLSCRHFTQLTAFSLGYGGQTPSIHVIERLLHSEDQMSISDIHILSKGVDCYEFNTGWSRTPIALQALSELSLLLDRRIVHWLGESTMLSKTTTLLTASRHGQRGDAHWVDDLAFKKCESQLDQLNAGITSLLVRSIAMKRFLPIPLLDGIISYVVRRNRLIPPKIQANLVIATMDLGYTSSSLETLLPIVGESLLREIYRFPGLTVLHCAMALLLHQRLSPQIVNAIFSVHFLDKLDYEVASCYSKATYPVRIRRILMELNRAVCVDLPECGVPWFHEHYCQEQLELCPPVRSGFHCNVADYLTQVLGGRQYFKSFTTTPYYHLIDFEVLLDSSGNPIHPEVNQMVRDNVEKVAILIRFPEDYTVNHRSLTGLPQMHQRHLEILGYRVIGIPYHVWNSMSLSSHQAKCEYLAKELQIHRNI